MGELRGGGEREEEGGRGASCSVGDMWAREAGRRMGGNGIVA